jgi:hypothetical protein
MIARMTDAVWQAAVLLAVLAVAVIVMLANRPAHSQQTNLGPFQTNVTVGTSATLAAVGANPSRRGLVICNGHASQSITVTFGTITPVSLTSGLVIPGGNVVASCWYAPVVGTGSGPVGGLGAQINMIASGASTPATVLEF